MNLSHSAPKRTQSRGEEVANSLSHGLGLVAAGVASPLLIEHGVRDGDTGFHVGVSTVAATTVLLYLASTLYTRCQSDAPSGCSGSSNTLRSLC